LVLASIDKDYPVIAEPDGIKLRTEKMIKDKLYYCIYENKVFLFYKDEDELLNCYEVENTDAVKEIAENPSEIENILRRYSQDTESSDREQQ
jgi:hypothetical protein